MDYVRCLPGPQLHFDHTVTLEFLAVPRVQTAHENFMITLGAGSDSDGTVPEPIVESDSTHSDFSDSDTEWGVDHAAGRDVKGG